jgi:hypothetical protein
MKTWIAQRLILLAVWLDVETVIYASFSIYNSLLDIIEKEEGNG